MLRLFEMSIVVRESPLVTFFFIPKQCLDTLGGFHTSRRLDLKTIITRNRIIIQNHYNTYPYRSIYVILFDTCILSDMVVSR